MTNTETRDYLTHHIKLVGRSDQPRPASPRRDLAANKTIVDESAARAAVTEVTTE